MILKTNKQPVCEPISLVEAKLHLRVDSVTEDALITSLIAAARQWCESYEGSSYIIRDYKLFLDGFYDFIQLPYGPIISVESVQYYDSAGVLQTLAESVYTVDTDSLPGRIYLAYNQFWPATQSIPKAVIINYTAGVAAKFITVFTAAVTQGENQTPASVVNTIYGRQLTNGQIMRVGTSAGTLPAGLVADTDYYVVNASGNTFQLSLTQGGSAVSITASSSGLCFIGSGSLVPERVKVAMKLILSHLYENRIEVSELDLKQIPVGAKHMLFERQF